MQLRVTTWYLQVCFFASICISSFGPRPHKWILNWQVEPGGSSKNKPMGWWIVEGGLVFQWGFWVVSGKELGKKNMSMSVCPVVIRAVLARPHGQVKQGQQPCCEFRQNILPARAGLTHCPPACHGSASLLGGRWGFFATPPPLVLPFFLFFFYSGFPC